MSLRHDLARQGLDAGPHTIVWHLEHHHHHRTVSVATVHPHTLKAGLVIAEPKKRPKSSYIRFQADQPNECWQSDFTHYPLADLTDTEILSRLDDHSRYALSVTAHRRVTGPIVLDTFRAAIDEHGPPTSTLTDNGMVFTTRFAGGRGGRNGFDHLRQSRTLPTDPQGWLDQRTPPREIPELQQLLDQFVAPTTTNDPPVTSPKRHPHHHL